MRSLRFRIMIIMMLLGIVPAIVIENAVVQSYEDRAVSQRSVIVKNQTRYLRVVTSWYLWDIWKIRLMK